MHLSWILFKNSLQRTKGRLALITGAVALGVMLLFTAASFHNALGNDTYTAWGRAVANEARAQADGAPEPDVKESVKIHIAVNDPLRTVGTRQFFPVDVDTAGVVNPPDLFGMTWPKDGEFLVSPGLRAIMNEHPEYRLEDRFGTKDRGDLPPQLTAGPDDLLVFRGRALPDSGTRISDFTQGEPESLRVSQIIMYLGLIVVIFPVLMLIAISATLGSVQREQRYAALRLVGATSRQIANIMVVEALVGAVLGYLVGVFGWLAIRPIYPMIPIDGERLWADSFGVSPLQAGVIALVAAGLVVAAHAWGMRGIRVSPLGVVRRQKTQGRPSPLRILPMLVSAGVLAFLYITVDHNAGVTDDAFVLLGCVIVMMVGIVVASPWVTYLVAGFLAKRARRAPSVIGLTYVRAHASRISRSVSGVLLALFAGTLFLTAVSEAESVFARESSQVHLLRTGSVVITNFDDDDAARTVALLKGEPEVDDIRQVPYIAGAWSVVDCAEIGGFMDIQCADGVAGVNLHASAIDRAGVVYADNLDDFKADVAQDFGAATSDPKSSLLVRLTNPDSVEQFRSTLARLDIFTLDQWYSVAFGGEKATVSGAATIVLMTYLVYGGIAGTLVIAVISMLVSTYASLLERRRSLLSLRLNGMRPKDMTAMMLIESVGPLVVMALIASMLGFATGWVMLQIFSPALDASFDVMLFVALGLALTLAALAMLSLVPTMKRMTQPANNRHE
ncbi:FtsX-like permease family protein [Arcanobacterium haemolyticum]